jgi:hypothetical protein
MTESPGVTGDAPVAGYWRGVAEDVRHELPGLLGANALLLAWCAPAALLLGVGLWVPAALMAPVTLGPGLAGLAGYAGRLARGESARWWGDSIAGVRAGSTATAVLVAVGLLAVGLPALALRLAVDHGLSTGTTAALSAQALVAAFLVIACVHAWSLVGLYRQRVGLALRNATLLVVRHPVSSAGLLGLGLAFIHLAQLFRWGPLVVLPAILGLCAVHHTRRLVHETGAITHETPRETTCPLP